MSIHGSWGIEDCMGVGWREGGIEVGRDGDEGVIERAREHS